MDNCRKSKDRQFNRVSSKLGINSPLLGLYKKEVSSFVNKHVNRYYLLVFGKFAHTFWVGRYGESSVGDFLWRRKFMGAKLCGGNFRLGEYAIIPLRISFNLPYFLFAGSILHVEMFMVIVWDKFLPGLNCLEDLSVRWGGGFSGGGAVYVTII